MTKKEMLKKFSFVIALAVAGLVCSLRIASLKGGKEAGFALFEPLNAAAFLGMFVFWMSAIGYGVYLAIQYFLKPASDAGGPAVTDASEPETQSSGQPPEQQSGAS